MLTPEELLDRCNQFRRAGGAASIDELAPGLRSHKERCLVARNMNFDCRVAYVPSGRASDPVVVIASTDGRLAAAAEALDLTEWTPPRDAPGYEGSYYVLPDDIADSVKAFDRRQYPAKLYAE